MNDSMPFPFAYILLIIPLLPLIVLFSWLFSPKFREAVSLRRSSSWSSTAKMALIVSAVGFSIVAILGLEFGVDYVVKALLLDRIAVSVLALQAASIGYVSLFAWIAIMLLDLRKRGHD